MDDRERLKIVIMQILEHNDVHLKEYEKWTRFAETNHLTDAGVLLGKAKHLVESENGVLQKVLDHLTSIDRVNS
jgi:hypothetical protein